MLHPKRYASDVALELVRGLQDGEIVLDQEYHGNAADSQEFLLQLKKQYSPTSLLREIAVLCIALILGTAVGVLMSHFTAFLSSLTVAACVCTVSLLMYERERRNRVKQIERKLQYLRRSAEQFTHKTKAEGMPVTQPR